MFHPTLAARPACWLALLCLPISATADDVPWPGALKLDSDPAARFEFRGFVGDRIRANISNWLLPAPASNPGMIGMFRMRDREPAPQLVPWAGEFAGKYLISAVQALRLSDNSELRRQTAEFVAELISTQAEDGYLGPFPKAARLRGNWDLWGHYHCIEGLLLWHEQTGDPDALRCARKAADLICRIYLDGGRRVLDAGDAEMNMAIIHGLGMLHRATSEPRYLRMMHEIERDWEKAGDYLRTGLSGVDFHRSPRPRWESLHDLQGLVELWRITGEHKYREAFEHHWRSIRRHDRRNTGGFSSGEQATGDPYAPTAIETCCTVAWTALTLDYLRLTGDPLAADDLELAALNAGLGAQHPTGRWWTYNTPMDGVREASAHTIVFQSRAGTPELNCCSVNGPRLLGMLSEWALMTNRAGLVVNSYLPATFHANLPDGSPVILVADGEYPVTNRVRLTFGWLNAEKEFTLALRIPAWAGSARYRVAGALGDESGEVSPGRYLELHRLWRVGDEVSLELGLGVREVAGAAEAEGRVSLYRGPLLLAWDQAWNDSDEHQLPGIDTARLAEATPAQAPPGLGPGPKSRRPWLVMEVPAADGHSLRLVDFASAGAAGTRYRSWLPATKAAPPPAVTRLPGDGAVVPPGRLRLRWRKQRASEAFQRLEFADNQAFTSPRRLMVESAVDRKTIDTKTVGLWDGKPVYWRVVTVDGTSETIPDGPAAFFRIDSSSPPAPVQAEQVTGPAAEVVVAPLRAGTKATYGAVSVPPEASVTTEGVQLGGRGAKIVTELDAWPEEDFTVAVKVRIASLPDHRLGQVFSAWAAGSDDPLRLVVEGGKLFARIEAPGGGSTRGAPLEIGRWYSVAAVKEGAGLRLYLDGRLVGECGAPPFSHTHAHDCALGGNPHFSGDESLAATFADFRLLARAAPPAEVAGWAAEQ